MLLNEPKLIICLYTVKWFQVLLYNSNNLIEHKSFLCTHIRFVSGLVWLEFQGIATIEGYLMPYPAYTYIH